MEPRPDRSAWLKGGETRCTPEPQPRERPWRLVLLGAPGVGKGTQAELLAARTGACPLSTGDVFRAARSLDACARSPALKQALERMQRGELVSDATALVIVSERLRCLNCKGGFLLDGFPRTLAQAEALDQLLEREMIGLDAVLSYEMPIAEIVARLSGRRTCGECKAVFHVTARPPRAEAVCDHCGGPLVQREDDRPEAVRVRMQAYEKDTAPLIRYYRRRGLLVPLPADGTPEQILTRAVAALVALAPRVAPA